MFLTLVEDKSRTTWVFLLSDKSAVPMMLKEFVMFIQTQFHTTIKVIRTDNGTELCNKTVDSFLKGLGIIHQQSCVYTPQQNGLVERKHRNLLNCARALRFHASLPILFWGDCILTAAYLVNRTPTVVLQIRVHLRYFLILPLIMTLYECLVRYAMLQWYLNRLINLQLGLSKGCFWDIHITRKVIKF